MTKIRLLISISLLVFGQLTAVAQTNYQLIINCIDKNPDFVSKTLALEHNFTSIAACREYTDKLIPLLQSKGFITASIDSLHFDSASAKMQLFAGELYQWKELDIKKIDPAVLSSIGWNEKTYSGTLTDFGLIQQIQEKFLSYFENAGYPFARVYFDSIKLDNGNISAQLKAEKGALYKIDSIRVFGTEKISNLFLQRWLDIPNGSIYNKQKLKSISSKIQQLDYIEENSQLILHT
jgi:outer membrane protein assembly factor BamA